MDKLDMVLASHNWSAQRDPGVNDDSLMGYDIGSWWLNVFENRIFICVDNSTGEAVWDQLYPLPAVAGPSSAVDGNLVSFDGVTGKIIKDSGSKPADFAPASKGVTNGDAHDHTGGDGAQIAYSGLGGIPSTFAPAAHKTSHQSGGTDAIKLDDLSAPDDNTDLNVSTTKHGLCPKAPNDVLEFLRGDGAWSAVEAPLKVASIKQVGSTCYGYKADSTLVSSSTNFGAVFNALVDAIKSGNECHAMIIIDAPDATTSTTAVLYDYLEVWGINDTTITTATDIDIFELPALGTPAPRYKCVLENLSLVYSGTATYSHYHVDMHDPTKCRVQRVKMTCPNIAAYSADQKGGLNMTATVSGCWLNVVEWCDDIFRIAFDRISDSWIQYNTISNFLLGPYSIVLGTDCNDEKILYNHIICDKLAGLYTSAATNNNQVVGNYFEPQNGAATAGNDEFGIRADGACARWTIKDNDFVLLNGCGMHFPVHIDFSEITGNNYYNCNYNSNADYHDFRISSSTAGHGVRNVIMGNIHYNDHSSGAGKAAAIAEIDAANDPNYNIITCNTIKGAGYAYGVVKVGAQSITTGANIETLS